MEVKRVDEHFRPKGTQELLAQATSCITSNDRLKAKIESLRRLAKESKITGSWAEVEEEMDRLNRDYKALKPTLSEIGFIEWYIQNIKNWLWQILYPDFNTTLAESRLEELFHSLQESREIENSKTPLTENLNSKLETFLLSVIGELFPKESNDDPSSDQTKQEAVDANSSLNQVKQEVIKLGEFLAQISEQIAVIKEEENFLITELARNGFAQPLNQRLASLQIQVESQIEFLETYLSTLREDYNPNQGANIDYWEKQKQKHRQQEIQNLEREIENLRNFLETRIQPLRTWVEQQNQNTNRPKNPQITDLNTKLRKLKNLEMEMRNIIRLIYDNLTEKITKQMETVEQQLIPEEVRIWQEYITELRQWRLNHEKEIQLQFKQFLEQHPLDPDLERTRIEELRKLIVDPNNPEELEHLRKAFPSGNFLYHGTKVKLVTKILNSGYIKSVKALRETQGKNVIHNSGYEGVSWSLNEIDAFPEDRYHLVGFFASPEEILEANQQFTIPSRPAPFELIQINREIEPNAFYDCKIQDEIYNYVSLWESNSVISNLISAVSFETKKASENYSTPMLIRFLNEHPDDRELAQKLRKFYQIRTKDRKLKQFQEIRENFTDSGSTIKLSEELLQQEEIPPAAVWIQALIDTGRINNDPDFKGLTSVREVVEKIPGTQTPLKKEFLKEKGYLDLLWEEQKSKITPIQVPVSKLYLVVPKHDLERYLQILARCDTNTWPKGIIVYDHRQIRLENFASLHVGDHATFTQWLRNLIPPKTPEEGYIDYCQTFLGRPEISHKDRTGYARHVLKDSIIPERLSIVKDGNSLVIRD